MAEDEIEPINNEDENSSNPFESKQLDEKIVPVA